MRRNAYGALEGIGDNGIGSCQVGQRTLEHVLSRATSCSPFYDSLNRSARDVFKAVTTHAEPPSSRLRMEDTVMSYSASDSPTDSAAHWIDTSLISDPALLNLMESYNWTPFLGHELGSSSSLAQNAFPITINQATTNNFELTNGLGNEHTRSGTQRKSSIVTNDATPGAFSTLELRSLGTERPAIDEVAKAKREKRRAQNRKAQQAFRQRKDSAIARLEREMQKLKSINAELSLTNRARLEEISELKTRLGALRLSPLIPVIDGQEVYEDKEGELSPSSRVPPSKEPVVPWIEWRGRLYIDNEALATSSRDNGRSSSS